jgi:hypothetical protein
MMLEKITVDFCRSVGCHYHCYVASVWRRILRIIFRVWGNNITGSSAMGSNQSQVVLVCFNRQVTEDLARWVTFVRN